jgi:hypothetical protein
MLRAHLILAAVVMTASTTGLQRQGGPPSPAATGLVVGQVVDADSGRPVGESVVTLSGGPGVQTSPLSPLPPGRKLITDSNGRFVFGGLATGTYGLSAVKPGYGTSYFGQVTPRGYAASLDLAEGERLLDARILMWRDAAITGRVVDEAGEPVVGARIYVRRVTMRGGRPALLDFLLGAGSPSTDDRGVYRIGGLAPGQYVVGISVTSTSIPERLVTDYFRATGDARAEMQIALFGAAPTMTSAGTEESQQVGEHILQLAGRMPTPPAPQEDGTLAIYTSVFYANGRHAGDAAPVLVRSGETRSGVDLNLRAVPAVTVSGRLEGPDGAVGIATVYLMRANGGEPVGLPKDAAATTVADASGTFTFLGVPVGQYVLTTVKWPRPQERAGQPTVVQAPGGAMTRGVITEVVVPDEQPTLWARQPVTVGDRDVSGLRVSLATGVRVSGRMVFEGGDPPFPPNRFELSIDAIEEWLQFTPTVAFPGEDWKFRSPQVPQGRYLVTIPVPSGWFVKSAMMNGRDIADGPVNLTEDVTDLVITLTNRGARVSGTVRDREARPDPAAAVIVFPADRRLWIDYTAYPRRIKDGGVKRDGRFSFGDLPSGDYFIVAAPRAAVDWSTPGFLERLAPVATRITLGEAEQRTLDLRVTQVK